MKTLMELAAHIALETRELIKSESATLRSEMHELIALIKAVPGEKGEKGDPGPAGADAVVDVDAIARAAAALVPAPKDGEPGKDAVVNHMQVVRDVLALIPAPRDGKDGVASRDEITEIVNRAVAAAVASEVQARVADAIAQLPKVQYRDVYREGETYDRGNLVTWGGSLWHCNESTTDKPGTSTAWTLAVKKGRDGTNSKGT